VQLYIVVNSIQYLSFTATIICNFKLKRMKTFALLAVMGTVLAAGPGDRG
jgi:hypothetical protein